MCSCKLLFAFLAYNRVRFPLHACVCERECVCERVWVCVCVHVCILEALAPCICSSWQSFQESHVPVSNNGGLFADPNTALIHTHTHTHTHTHLHTHTHTHHDNKNGSWISIQINTRPRRGLKWRREREERQLGWAEDRTMSNEASQENNSQHLTTVISKWHHVSDKPEL